MKSHAVKRCLPSFASFPLRFSSGETNRRDVCVAPVAILNSFSFSRSCAPSSCAWKPPKELNHFSYLQPACLLETSRHLWLFNKGTFRLPVISKRCNLCHRKKRKRGKKGVLTTRGGSWKQIGAAIVVIRWKLWGLCTHSCRWYRRAAHSTLCSRRLLIFIFGLSYLD